jgi:hypothetical protein
VKIGSVTSWSKTEFSQALAQGDVKRLRGDCKFVEAGIFGEDVANVGRSAISRV